VKGGAAANDESLAVNRSLNNNDLFSNNKTAAAKEGGQATVDGNNTKVEADKGGQAANNGSTNVKQDAFAITNELPGSHPSTTDSHNTTDSHATTTTSGGGSTGNNSIGSSSANAVYLMPGANNQSGSAKYKSDNPSADDGSQLMTGGSGSQTMNTADDGGIVATGAGSVTSNKADDGGIVSTGAGSVVTDGGQLATTAVQNKGKNAALNSNQTVNENNADDGGIAGNQNVRQEASKGGINAVGDVLTVYAEKGGIAAAPGSAVSKIDLQGSVEHNDIRFGGDVTSVTKSGSADSGKAESGKAYSGKAESGKAYSGKAESGSAFSISASKSKSGGNGAAALGGAFSESEATATGAASPGIDGGFPTISSNRGRQSGQGQDPGSVEATSDESNALSVNVAVAKDGNSKNTSRTNATSGSADSGSADSGSADSGSADSGYAKSGRATSGDVTGAATYQVNRFTTGTNNLAFGGSFNGVGTFNANSGVNALNQSPISINAVVGGSVAGTGK
jgi:hypothetical protein